MRYDLLKTSTAKKDSAISSKDREIDEKKARIQSLLSNANATKAQLMEAKRLIASLYTDIQGYKQQVEILKGQNIQLTQEKQAVTQEKVIVEKNLESAKTVIKEKEDLHAQL
jgi:chromosome segregation ATPase